MREILFRAKKDDHSNFIWIYGSIFYKNEVPRITNDGGETYHTCVKGTESQFTGLTDKNGTKVFEGDILENAFTIKNYEDDDYHLENRYSSQYETKTCKSEVKFIKGEFRITSGVSFNNCKIIGNIHDNPELLK